MKTHLNTLFVTTDGSYLAKDGQAVVVRLEGKIALRVPVHLLQSIVCLARVGMSPALMSLCAEKGVSVSFHSPSGRLIARVTGFTRGNVLLRRAQFRASEDPEQSIRLARMFLVGKIANARVLLLRAIRDHGDPSGELTEVAGTLGRLVVKAGRSTEATALRGLEGEAASLYFRVFPRLIRSSDERLTFSRRSRRPPRDPANALLSFAYAILSSDVRSACEAVGLDSQIGFLHVDRPGRPALALDLMEELRSVISERVVLSVLNRRQLTFSDFSFEPTGACRLTSEGRKSFLAELQRRKSDELEHPYLGEKVTLGMVPILQARLFAKALRGELDNYPPFLWR